MKVELRSVPGCPNLPAARDTLRVCLAELDPPVPFTELVGDYPSPSVLVDGTDVMGTTGSGAACRLDLPTAAAGHRIARTVSARWRRCRIPAPDGPSANR
ncbi:hypothetical protein [Longispora urticae]